MLGAAPVRLGRHRRHRRRIATTQRANAVRTATATGGGPTLRPIPTLPLPTTIRRRSRLQGYKDIYTPVIVRSREIRLVHINIIRMYTNTHSYPLALSHLCIV
jgi:hypothetical protein